VTSSWFLIPQGKTFVANVSEGNNAKKQEERNTGN